MAKVYNRNTTRKTIIKAYDYSYIKTEIRRMKVDDSRTKKWITYDTDFVTQQAASDYATNVETIGANIANLKVRMQTYTERYPILTRNIGTVQSKIFLFESLNIFIYV